MRVRSLLALAALPLAVAACGGGGGGGKKSNPTATPSSTATSTSSGSTGGAKVKLLVRAVTPGQTTGKPQAKAHVSGSQTAQFLAYPTGATSGDVLEVRIPDLSGGRSRATAEILHGGQAGASATAELNASSGSSISAVRYVCQVSNAPSYCPAQGAHRNGAYVLRTHHLKAGGPLVIVVALG